MMLLWTEVHTNPADDPEGGQEVNAFDMEREHLSKALLPVLKDVLEDAGEGDEVIITMTVREDAD